MSTHLGLSEDEYVASGEVAVNESLALQVRHAVGHLLGEVTEARQREVLPHHGVLQTVQQGAHRGQLRHLATVEYCR